MFTIRKEITKIDFLKSGQKFDFWLFGAMILVCLVGFITLYSVVINFETIPKMIVTKHIISFLIGLGSIIFMIRYNYYAFKKYATGLYWVSIVLLILVLILGSRVRGIKSWFILGPFSFQPVEFAKLAFIIFLANYIEQTPRWMSFKDLSWPILFMALPVGLVLLQPDLGSSLVFFPIFLGMMYLGRCKGIYLLSLLAIVVIALGLTIFNSYISLKQIAEEQLLWTRLFNNINFLVLFLVSLLILLGILYYLVKKIKLPVSFKNFVYTFGVIVSGILLAHILQFFLRDYQKKRLIIFLDPYLDPLGAGYNLIQSKIAVGSGGLLGKGLFSGTQSRLGFLPEQHTDFIFSVLAEQLGFLGTSLVIILFFIIIWRGILVARIVEDEFGSLVAGGIVCMFVFNVFLNIGMTIGIMPITGIPLPLLSYGGSSLVINMLAIGILLNIRLKRFMY